MVLTPEQVGQYQTYVGQKAQQALNLFINDPFYQLKTDEEKAKFISSVLSDINSAAKIELFGNTPKSIDKGTRSVITGKYGQQPNQLKESPGDTLFPELYQ